MVFPPVSDWAAAADRLAPALLNAAAGSVVVLGLAGGAAAALRRASAAARHEVWLLGFAGVLLLPALSAALPAWHVLPHVGANWKAAGPPEGPAAPPATPSPTPVAMAKETATGLPSPADGAAGGQPPAPANTEEPVTGSARATAATPATPATPAAAAASQPARPFSPAAGSAPTLIAPAAGGMPWTVWPPLCWAVGCLLVLSRVFLGHLSLWVLRRRCTRVTRGEMFDLLERLRAEAGIRRPVELLSSPNRTMPMTWGLWHARLLVPEQAAAWPASQRRDVLLHELGHVGRRDCLTQLLAQVACAAYWFNPLAWVAGRRMQVERERACDDLVLNGGAEAASYATHLLQSVSAVPAPPLVGAAVAMARPSTLEERMRAILNRRLNRRSVTAGSSLGATLVLLAVVVPVSVLSAQPAPPPLAPPGQPPIAEPGPPVRESADAKDAADAKSRPPGVPTTRPATNPQSPRPALPPGGRFGSRSFGGGGPAALTLGEGPTCTLDATIYDVRMPVDQIGRLDVDALAAAAGTPDAFEKALATLGTSQPLYRASQSVRLSGDSITIGSTVPFVTNTRMTDKGQAINTVSYQEVGAVFGVAGKAAAAGALDLDLSIQVASSTDGGAQVSEKVKALVIRKTTLSHKGPVQARKPFVIVSVDAGSVDKDGKAVAYVGRVTIGEPQPPASK
jgi:beta-lactamase regulating signal transducer with metallopeptidase domain